MDFVKYKKPDKLKYVLKVLLFLLYSLSSSAQHIPNAVDSIDSQERLQRFVDKQLRMPAQFHYFRTGRFIPEWVQCRDFGEDIFGFSKFYNNFLDTFSTDPCIRKDFNADGKTDMVVQCRARTAIFCFFSTADKGFEVNTLYPPEGWLEGRIFLKKLDKVGLQGLNIYNIKIDTDKTVSISHDTLIYKFGHLLPLNTKPSKRAYKSIKVYTDHCYGPCPVYSIVIEDSGKITYSAIENCGTNFMDHSYDGGYFYLLSKDSFKTLCNMLDYIAPQSLDSLYQVGHSDDQTIYTEITYADGKKKKIKDYGKRGTYGLTAFYEYIENLRRNVKWVRMLDK